MVYWCSIASRRILLQQIKLKTIHITTGYQQAHEAKCSNARVWITLMFQKQSPSKCAYMAIIIDKLVSVHQLQHVIDSVFSFYKSIFFLYVSNFGRFLNHRNGNIILTIFASLAAPKNVNANDLAAWDIEPIKKMIHLYLLYMPYRCLRGIICGASSESFNWLPIQSMDNLSLQEILSVKCTLIPLKIIHSTYRRPVVKFSRFFLSLSHEYTSYLR